MKVQATNIEIGYNAKMIPFIKLPLLNRSGIEQTDELLAQVANGKTLDVEIKVHREKRSLDANGMLWSVLQKIAEVLRSSKEELYLQMLKKYGGKFTYVVIQPEAFETLRRLWREVEVVGKGKINGKECLQLICYYGSSFYDTREFAVLLDGVLYEAKEIGIEVISESEKNLLLEERRKNDGN